MEHGQGVWRRLLACVLAAVMVTAGVAGLARGAPAVTGGPALTVMPDSATAMATARRQGVAVEDVSARTEVSRVFAEPSGSWTVESSVTPRWVRRADGVWADIDTSLARRADGSLAPKASVADVQFSGGGSGPLVTMRQSGHTFTLSWPGSLPAPVVDGASATYPEIVPGADLVVRATRTGFSHVLVVKSRQAAANPAVRNPRFRVGGDVTMSGTPEGGLRVTAGATLVASAGEAMMWDSSSTGAGPSVARSTVAAPADGARQAVIAARAGGGELALTPDIALLDSPAAVFPIFIDPDFATGVSNWTYATSNNTGSPTTDTKVAPGDSPGPNARVGRDVEVGKLVRSFFEFPLVAGGHDLRGKHILSARFAGWVDHSTQCGYGTPTSFYRTAGISVTPRQSWPGPQLLASIGNFWSHANEGSCSEPNAYFEIIDNALLADVQHGAWSGWSSYTIGLSAVDPNGSGESTSNRWKKYFVNDLRLSVTYNTGPNTPTDLETEGQDCVRGSGRPWLGTATPTLSAVVTDPDSNETDLRLSVDWWDGTRSTQLGTLRQSPLASGARGQVTLPPLAQGNYAWRTLSDDGTDWAANFSDWCEFSVDTERPANVPVVSSPVYQDDLINSYGSIGQTADFTFAANGVADVKEYRYGWNDPPGTTVAAPDLGASVTIPLTPPPIPESTDPTRGGRHTLSVRSVDRAGNMSDIKRYIFLIRSASSPKGEWRLNETSGTTLEDSSGYEHPATLSGGTLGTPGPVAGQPAVSFDGVDDYAATAGPIVDTGTSFTVAAWVRLDDAARPYQTVVSQIGSRISAFYLQKHQNTWSLSLHTPDADTSTGFWARSTSAPAVGPWTHLAGVYDRGSNTAWLYVNGVLAGTATGVSAFNASGPLWIGRARSGGQPADQFAGAVSGVRVWDRVLHPTEVSRLATR